MADRIRHRSESRERSRSRDRDNDRDIHHQKETVEETEEDLKKKLFIGNLGYTTNENDLLETFQKCGEIVLTRVMIDKTTGKSRGFGFVAFNTVEEAEHAYATMQGQLINNRAIRIDRSTPKNSTKKYANRVNQSNIPHADSFGRYGDRGRVADSRYNVSRNSSDGRYDTRDNDNSYSNQQRQHYGGNSYGVNDSYARDASSTQQQSQNQQYDPSVCFAFQRGHCKYGDKCRYSHDMSLIRTKNDVTPDQGYTNSRQSQQYVSNNNSSVGYSSYSSGGDSSSYQPPAHSQYGPNSSDPYQSSNSRGDPGGGGYGGYSSNDYYAAKSMAGPTHQQTRGTQQQQLHSSGYEYEPTAEYDYNSGATNSYRPSGQSQGSASVSAVVGSGANGTLSHLYAATSGGGGGYRNQPHTHAAVPVDGNGSSSRYDNPPPQQHAVPKSAVPNAYSFLTAVAGLNTAPPSAANTAASAASYDPVKYQSAPLQQQRPQYQGGVSSGYIQSNNYGYSSTSQQSSVAPDQQQQQRMYAQPEPIQQQQQAQQRAPSAYSYPMHQQQYTRPGPALDTATAGVSHGAKAATPTAVSNILSQFRKVTSDLYPASNTQQPSYGKSNASTPGYYSQPRQN